MLLQVRYPYPGDLAPQDRVLLAFNGMFIGAGIFANLAFEVIGLDLLVIALLAIIAVWLLRRRGPQPLVLYYSVAYLLRLVLTLSYPAIF